MDPSTAESSAIERAYDYILKHVYDIITLDKLEEISGRNKFTLIRNFKKLYTTTPAAFHLQCRVSEAKQLLSNGNNVFEICGDLNFYDQAHLIKEFKKMYGDYTQSLYGTFINSESILYNTTPPWCANMVSAKQGGLI